MTRAPALAFLALAVSACSSHISYQHTHNPQAPFDRYRTVAILQAQNVTNFTRGELNAEQLDAARREASGIFDQKGWTVVDDRETADLLLVFGVGARVRVESRYQGTVRYDSFEAEINEGTIVLDAFDRRTRDRVWHGQVIGAGDPPAPPERVAEGVRTLLSEFPDAGQGEPLTNEVTSGADEPAAPEDETADPPVEPDAVDEP